MNTIRTHPTTIRQSPEDEAKIAKLQAHLSDISFATLHRMGIDCLMEKFGLADDGAAKKAATPKAKF